MTTALAAASPAFRPRVRRLGPGRYLIESKTQPGVGHQVNVPRHTCSCPAGKRGVSRCWHRTLAATLNVQFEAWFEAHQQQARATARLAGMAALQEAFGS